MGWIVSAIFVDLDFDLPHFDLPHSDLPHSDLPHSDLPHSDLPHSDLLTPTSSLRPPHSDLRFERRQRALMARAGVSRPRAVATASVGGDRRHRAHRMSAVNIPTSRWVIQAALA